MENSSPGQEGPEIQPFYCHLCGVSCASALNLQSHFLGFKHKKAEETLRNHGESDARLIATKSAETLEDQINACKAHEPAVGLEYIYEFQNNGYSTFACKLCSCQLKLMHMFMHIVGAKHRINYLSKHHPALGFTATGQVTSSKKIKRLRKVCIDLEKKFGRQKIEVVQGPYIPWSFPKHAPSSGINYGPKSKLEKMDFTNEDFIDPECTSTVRDHAVTFLELKAAHGAKLKTETSFNRSLSPEVIVPEEEDHDNNEENEDSGQEKSSDSKEDASNKDCSNGPEDFTNHKELIDFLESFLIVEASDVTFVLNVSKKLTDALLHYKKCRIEDEKKKKIKSDLSASNEQKPNQHLNQSALPSVMHPCTSQDSTTNGNKIKTFQPFKITNKAPTTALLPERPQEFAMESNQIVSYDTRQDSASHYKIQQHMDSRSENRDVHAHPRPQLNAVGSKSQDSASHYKIQQHMDSRSENRDVHAHPRPQLNAVGSKSQELKEQRFPNPQLHNSGVSMTPSYHFPQGHSTGISPEQNFYVPVYDQITSPTPPSVLYPHAIVNNAAPGPSVSEFPVAKDHITAQFFESIKNMDVSEVVSTLNKITATNPAFRGINVPSLVQYLTKTGMLKSSYSTQESKH